MANLGTRNTYPYHFSVCHLSSCSALTGHLDESIFPRNSTTTS